MKKAFAGVLAGVLLCAALPAAAGWERHDRHGHGHYRDHHRHGGSSWVVPGLVLGAGAIAVEAFRPPPVIVAPAPVVLAPPPPARVWYFCDMYQAYYPYVQHCPNGWRAVPSY